MALGHDYFMHRDSFVEMVARGGASGMRCGAEAQWYDGRVIKGLRKYYYKAAR